MQYTVEDISSPTHAEGNAYPYTLILYFIDGMAKNVEIDEFLGEVHAWCRDQFGPPKKDFIITPNGWGFHEDNPKDPHNHPVWWGDQNVFRLRHKRDATAFRLRFG
ncbi:MAG: hypothetical protein EOP83_11785 [Verrucomicrobiaceae bacterium]|nr:MAG: hypothetical protein EOP83_11785 [Verrucomicrobiaceae bacterium]